MKSTDEGTPPDLKFLMAAFDWQEVMKYARDGDGKFDFEDIALVLYAREGENDGPSWELVVVLKDGSLGWVTASCDYTGWGCGEGGESGRMAHGKFRTEPEEKK